VNPKKNQKLEPATPISPEDIVHGESESRNCRNQRADAAPFTPLLKKLGWRSYRLPGPEPKDDD
jgi:5'-3' exonuclease